MASLCIAQWNIENLFIYMDRFLEENLETLTENQWQSLSMASIKNKPLKKLKQIREVITDISPDILMLNEVGGKASLDHFIHYFLDDCFYSQIIEGNSDRGIDVAYLIRKGLPFDSHINTYKDKPIPLTHPSDLTSQKYYFSRDVSELRLYEKESDELKFVFLLTHLKSKLDPENIDPLGRRRREAEVKALVEIYKKISQKTPHIPIVIAGDFNGCVQKDQFDPEYLDFVNQTDLVDVFDICSVELRERMTQIQFQKHKEPSHLQLDYIFCLSVSERSGELQRNLLLSIQENGAPSPSPSVVL